jgi:class 3 adenylate cyclase/CheY-like chemotaxis protein/HAMP domain-containing protein
LPPLRVLVVQSTEKTSSDLANFFSRRGDQVWQTSDAVQAAAQLEQINPDLMLVDLHLPGAAWQDLARRQKKSPHTQLIMTSSHPDYRSELLARELGARVFLREPFTPRWIEQALAQFSPPSGDSSRLQGGERPLPAAEKHPAAAKKPRGAADSFMEPFSTRVRIPVRVKITFPYILLAILFSLVGAYLVSQVILESIQDRFNNQLVETGKQDADWMVRQEDSLLETLRLVANTTGMADAIRTRDAGSLQEMILPLAVNAKEEAIEILDDQGTSVISLRHVADGGMADYTSTQGETIFAQWDFVQSVLKGQIDQGRDKYAGLERAPWGDFFYVSGPVHSSDGSLVGVVLVGISLPGLVREMSLENLAESTLYDFNGQPMASTLFTTSAGTEPLAAQQAISVVSGQANSSLVRDLVIGSVNYSEIIGPWKARSSQTLGLLGAALPQSFLVTTNRITQTQIFLLVAGAFLLVILIGVTISNQITRPLLRIVKASAEVARGNLNVKVEPRGNDEVAVLSRTFNYMVVGLQEGSIYRDLLGRTVSPEVREQLRQTFTSGNLHLEGQQAVATVLMSDIKGFTSLSEQVDAAAVFKWLNEYFGKIVPVIANNNGVVNKFDGDAMLAFFGLLPRLLSPKQSAYAGCLAALQMLEAIDELNRQRSGRGEPLLNTGIGVNTGVVSAGGLGTTDRLHYTIIGDTVNTTQRLESLTRTLLEGTGVIIGQTTYESLGDYRREFDLQPLGSHAVRGKSEEVSIYRLLGRLNKT